MINKVIFVKWFTDKQMISPRDPITFYYRYYTATIIHMAGVKNDQTAILLSAVMAAINFLFNVLGLYLVERIGRRALTISSLIGTEVFS